MNPKISLDGIAGALSVPPSPAAAGAARDGAFRETLDRQLDATAPRVRPEGRRGVPVEGRTPSEAADPATEKAPSRSDEVPSGPPATGAATPLDGPRDDEAEEATRPLAAGDEAAASSPPEIEPTAPSPIGIPVVAAEQARGTGAPPPTVALAGETAPVPEGPAPAGTSAPGPQETPASAARGADTPGPRPLLGAPEPAVAPGQAPLERNDPAARPAAVAEGRSASGGDGTGTRGASTAPTDGATPAAATHGATPAEAIHGAAPRADLAAQNPPAADQRPAGTTPASSTGAPAEAGTPPLEGPPARERSAAPPAEASKAPQANATPEASAPEGEAGDPDAGGDADRAFRATPRPSESGGGEAPRDLPAASEAARPTEARAAPPAAAPAAPRTADLQGLLDQVRLQVRPGLSRINVVVDPPELGRIAIRLSLKAGRLVGEISADSPEVARTLREGLDALRQTIRQSGVAVDQLDVRSETGSDRQAHQRHEAGGPGAEGGSEGAANRDARRLARAIARVDRSAARLALDAHARVADPGLDLLI